VSGARAVVARDLAQAAAWRAVASAAARAARTLPAGWTSVRQEAYGEAIAAAREWLASARSVRLELEPRPACSGCPDGCRECEELNMPRKRLDERRGVVSGDLGLSRPMRMDWSTVKPGDRLEVWSGRGFEVVLVVEVRDEDLGSPLFPRVERAVLVRTLEEGGSCGLRRLWQSSARVRLHEVSLF